MISTLMWFLEPPAFKSPRVLSCNGAIVEYNDTDGRRTLTRMFSTDPMQYLDRRLSPGEDITSLIGFQDMPDGDDIEPAAERIL